MLIATLLTGHTPPLLCLSAFPLTGDTCRYSSCNDGYELSAFGSTSRKCDWTDTNYREVNWDGSAKTCESASKQRCTLPTTQ